MFVNVCFFRYLHIASKYLNATFEGFINCVGIMIL